MTASSLPNGFSIWQFHEFTAGMDADKRLDMFLSLPASTQARAYLPMDEQIQTFTNYMRERS